MRELPIIFNPDMVRAIRNYKKTQTRRVMEHRCRYAIGDLLYVCESFVECDGKIIYKADLPEAEWEKYKWMPAYCMPDEYSREQLKVFDIRGQNLQDIDINSIIEEGITPTAKELELQDKEFAAVIRRRFIELWDSIYEKRGYGYDTNPFVVVIEFKRIEI